MCFWIFRSKPFLRVRICALWSIIFLIGCLYTLHFKTTVKKWDTISDSNYKNTQDNDSVLRAVDEPPSSYYNKTDEMTRSVTPDFNLDDSTSDEIGSTNEDVNNSEEKSYEIVTPSESERFNDSTLKGDSSNRRYEDRKESESSKNIRTAPQINKREHIPRYEELVTKHISSVNPNYKRSSFNYNTLPVHCRRWNVHWTVRDSGKYPTSLYEAPPGEYPQQRLPKAIMIGAGKCGTRALLEFLAMHPLIVPAKMEVHYFDNRANFNKGLEWYTRQMPLSFSNQMTIEKSPSYMWSSVALKEIKKMDKNIKLLVILKDPVDRVISQAIRTQHEDIKRLFMDKDATGKYRVKSESNTIQWSVYVSYLRLWLGTFSPAQIHIVEAKELAANPSGEIKKIEKFLKVPPMIQASNFYFNKTKGFHCMRPLHLKNETWCLSEGKGRAHPKLEPWLKKMLYDYFTPYNEELFSLLGRRFEWGYKE